MMVSRSEAVTLLLARQGLTTPGYSRSADTSLDGVVACIEAMGVLQIDTIHVVARSPYIVLWSRLGRYDPLLLERALEERRIYEYWSHEASFLPVGHLPCSRVLMHQRDTNPRRVRLIQRMDANAELVSSVLAHVAATGETRAADFARDVPGSGQGWWDWKPEKMVLEDLFMLGRLTVARRERFHRIYRLWEQHFPELDDATLPDDDAVADQHVRVAARALGVATAGWIADYFRRPQAETKAAIARLIASGELIRMEIEDIGLAYATPDTDGLLGEIRAGLRRPSGTILLSPFDPVVWHRARALDLFGFDYRIECYTPEAKRRYGYFSLPILHDGQLVGRLDPKAYRRERRLEIRALHLEPGVQITEGLIGGIALALTEFAAWQDLDDVEILASAPPILRRRLGPALRRLAPKRSRRPVQVSRD